MRFFAFMLIGSFLVLGDRWGTDFETARKKAEKEHKYILLNFSGSDWCGPCIRLRSEIFESNFFESFADSNLVLVNADFPRLKKNQLAKELQARNNKLADQYNPQGIFPCTLLLDANGKVIKEWAGYISMRADQFTDQIKDNLNARK